MPFWNPARTCYEHRVHIHAYGLNTAAGSTTDDLWNALSEGRDVSQSVDSVDPSLFPTRVCLWHAIPGHSTSFGATLHRVGHALATALDEFEKTFAPGFPALQKKRGALILASTKGVIDDFVWSAPDNSFDTFAPLRNFLRAEFLRRGNLNFSRTFTVSNACTSTLSALLWAEVQLDLGMDYVVIAAVDAVGPFVQKGFTSIRALTSDRHRSFAKDRSGLQLGEAAGFLLVSRENEWPRVGSVEGIQLEAQGQSVTRPSRQGESLLRAFQGLPVVRPDAVLAHGTATSLNDSTEDQAFTAYFESRGWAPALVSGTKWSIGHTLGASALVDVVIACQMLQKQRVFRMHNTIEVDPSFRQNYFSRSSAEPTVLLERVLVSSLGFGGLHAGALISRGALEKKPSLAAASRQLSVAEKLFSVNIEWPLANPSATWQSKVDRASQLDPSATVLCEAYARFASKGLPHSPQTQILACPDASNDTDLAFVATGASSPAKFVHTLPNIRATPLFQLMNWHGPLHCFQGDDDIFTEIVRDAKAQLQIARESGASIWIWHLRAEKDFYKVDLLVLQSAPTGSTIDLA